MGRLAAVHSGLAVCDWSLAARAERIHAFGHGHLGLTFGAVTANIVGQLARNEAPNLDAVLSAMRVNVPSRQPDAIGAPIAHRSQPRKASL